MSSTTIHFMQYGHTACLINGPPNEWPDGHKWSDDWKDVTCPLCRAGRELISTFVIAPDGKSITCRRCNMTSYNLNDVEQHFCGKCRVFHDNIWPPARKAWIDGGKMMSTYMSFLVCDHEKQLDLYRNGLPVATYYKETGKLEKSQAASAEDFVRIQGIMKTILGIFDDNIKQIQGLA